MKPWSKVLVSAVVLSLSVSTGYGWGSATHVLFARCLGSPLGRLNQNEMYGSVVLDMFGYEFSNSSALAVDYALHTEGDLLWALYAGAGSAEARAFVYGCFTHTNSPAIKGADWYAHGVYPGDWKGWVIRQGAALASTPAVSSYLVDLVGPEHAEDFGMVVGHTLVETAVDILVKRNDDPLVGLRLYLAARNRTDEVSEMLSTLQASFFPTSEGYPDIAGRERIYREEMMQYGQLFMLPEAQMRAVLSEQTALLAQAYIKAAYGLEQEIAPTKVSEFLNLAIDQVSPLYRKELLATLFKVGMNMRRFGPPPAGPIFTLFRPNGSDGKFPWEEQSSEAAPATFSLAQNYPNPFNPATTINFTLPVETHVRLVVYNSIGQEVAQLVDEVRSAGVYQASWDAGALPSGVYFCRLTAGNFSALRKMTFVK